MREEDNVSETFEEAKHVMGQHFTGLYRFAANGWITGIMCYVLAYQFDLVANNVERLVNWGVVGLLLSVLLYIIIKPVELVIASGDTK